jgi:hypothetical protein
MPDGRVWSESYPWTQNGIVYFPLAAMRTLYVLTDEERAELNALRSSRWVPVLVEKDGQ